MSTSGSSPADTLLAALGTEEGGDPRRRWQASWRASTSSTQDDIAAAGAVAGRLHGRWLLACAASQRAGRGRGGARWFADPDGAVLLTVAAELDAPPARWPQASLVVGAALAERLSQETGTDVRWKWPNDLLAVRDGRWRKLGGCLAERHERAGLPPLWSIGVGINQSRAGLPAAISDAAVALNDYPAWSASDPGHAAATVAATIRACIGAWGAEGWRLDLVDLQRRLAFVGDTIRCNLGREETEGRLLGLSADGGLRLDRGGVYETVLPLAIVGADATPPWHPPARLDQDG